MKQLKRDLDAVLKSLNTLAEKVKKMQSTLAGAEPVKVPKAAAAKAAGKAKKTAPAPKKTAKGKTAYETVLEIINRSKKGATTAQLKSKTGFNDKKIANLIYKARKQGKVKSEQKGVYVKA